VYHEIFWRETTQLIVGAKEAAILKGCFGSISLKHLDAARGIKAIFAAPRNIPVVSGHLRCRVKCFPGIRFIEAGSMRG